MPENPDLVVRPMSRDDLDVAVEWAAAEGWNPGLHDADVFWATDPEGFVRADLGGEMVGSGSIVAYGEAYGFMGFFIMKPGHRGHGLGRQLWVERKRRLRSRLRPDAPIEMDGVFTMQDFYARGGFQFLHRDLRFTGSGLACAADPSLVPLAEVPGDLLHAYDRAHFPAPRRAFLDRWIRQPESLALGAMATDGARLAGYAVIRRCRVGFKIGPLFADDAPLADRLFRSVAAFARGGEVFLDVPEANPAALALVADHGLREVFGCARMADGPAPTLPQHEIFGVTSFELG